MKVLPFLSLLLLPTWFFAQVGPNQVNIETRFLVVNQNFSKEIGITFGGGIAAGRIGNNENDHFGLAPTFAAGVETEPCNNLFVRPMIELVPFVSQNDFIKLKVTNVAISVPAIVATDNKPVCFGFGLGPIFTFAIGGSQKYLGERQKWELGDNVNKFNVGIQALPEIRIRNTVTDVIVQGGATIMLGGLYESTNTQTTNNSVPILAHLAVIGKFFTNRKTQRERENLIVIIRPKLVEPAVD